MREMPFRACHRTERLQRRQPCAARSTGCSLASSRRVRHRPRRRGWRHGLHIFRTGLGQFVSKQEWLPSCFSSTNRSTQFSWFLEEEFASMVIAGLWYEANQYGDCAKIARKIRLIRLKTRKYVHRMNYSARTETRSHNLLAENHAVKARPCQKQQNNPVGQKMGNIR